MAVFLGVETLNKIQIFEHLEQIKSYEVYPLLIEKYSKCTGCKIIDKLQKTSKCLNTFQLHS